MKMLGNLIFSPIRGCNAIGMFGIVAFGASDSFWKGAAIFVACAVVSILTTEWWENRA